MLDKNRSRAPLESALSGEVPVAERYRCRSRAERIIPVGLTTPVDLTAVPCEEQPDTTRPLIPTATAKTRIFNLSLTLRSSERLRRQSTRSESTYGIDTGSPAHTPTSCSARRSVNRRLGDGCRDIGHVEVATFVRLPHMRCEDRSVAADGPRRGRLPHSPAPR